MPRSTASRNTATAASRSAGGPKTCDPASCIAPYPMRVTARSAARVKVPPERAGTLDRRRFLEVMPPIEVCTQSHLGRKPLQLLLRCGARRWNVHAAEKPEEAEMIAGLVGRFRYGRHVQMPADDLGNLSKRHALVADGMIASVCRILFGCESVETRGVEP